MILQNEAYYVTFLKNELQRRKEKNRAYSLRGFAHSLSIDPSSLSRILLGKEPISIQNTKKIIAHLNLNDADRSAFLASVSRERQQQIENMLLSDGTSRSAIDNSPHDELASLTVRLDTHKLDHATKMIEEFLTDFSNTMNDKASDMSYKAVIKIVEEIDEMHTGQRKYDNPEMGLRN